MKTRQYGELLFIILVSLLLCANCGVAISTANNNTLHQHQHQIEESKNTANLYTVVENAEFFILSIADEEETYQRVFNTADYNENTYSNKLDIASIKDVIVIFNWKNKIGNYAHILMILNMKDFMEPLILEIKGNEGTVCLFYADGFYLRVSKNLILDPRCFVYTDSEKFILEGII